MRYQVVLTCSEHLTPGIEPKTAMQFMERTILPTLDTLSKWEKEKRVFGGCPAGARGISFYIDANSNEEIGELVHQLPIWPYVNSQIIPLESFEFRFNQERKFVNEAKKQY